MTNKEVIMQLEIMATNLTGAICETNMENIRDRILTQIEALDMAIDALDAVQRVDNAIIELEEQRYYKAAEIVRKAVRDE